MSFKTLYNQCSRYQKIAELSISSIHAEENTNPFLDEISSLKSFEERVDLAKEKFKQLGEGSSRTIFQMDDKMVLKIAHNDKGIQQNLAEMDPKMQRPCTNNIVVADAKGKWVIVRFTDTVTEKSFKKLTDISFSSFMNALFYKFNNESDQWSPPRDYEDIEKSELFSCIAELIFQCDLQIGDIDKPSSWGELDGKAVLRDFGLTREVFKDYYKSDSSDSSTSKSSS